MPRFAPGYCRRCDAEREILLTVEWQSDNCTHCGSPDVEVTTEPAPGNGDL